MLMKSNTGNKPEKLDPSKMPKAFDPSKMPGSAAQDPGPEKKVYRRTSSSGGRFGGPGGGPPGGPGGPPDRTAQNSIGCGGVAAGPVCRKATVPAGGVLDAVCPCPGRNPRRTFNPNR